MAEQFDVAVVEDLHRRLSSHVDALDVDLISGDGAVRLSKLFSAIVSTATAGLAQCAARVDSSGAHNASSHISSKALVADATGSSVADAAATIDFGKRLSEQPETREALSSGDISVGKADEISRAASLDPDRGRQMLDDAHKHSLESLRRSRRDIGRQMKSHEERLKNEWMKSEPSKSNPGMTFFCGEITNENWAEYSAVHDPLANKIFRENRGLGYSQCKVRAMLTMARGFGKGDFAKAKAKASVNVIVDYEALIDGDVASGEQCMVPGVGAISVDSAREYLKESWLNLLIRKGRDIRTIASDSRYIPRDVARILNLRERVCSVRGCGISVGLQNDHRDERRDGGLSKADNLGWLCTRHHRMKTSREWTVVGKPGDYLMIRAEDIDLYTPEGELKDMPPGRLFDTG